MQNTMDSRRFRLSRFLGPRFERMSQSDAPTYPDDDVDEPTQQSTEEPTQVWTGGQSVGTRVAVPRPVLSTYDDRAHPDLRLYDAVSGEPTDILSASEAFRQLELSQRAHGRRAERTPRRDAARRETSEPFADPTEPFADPTVPDVALRESMPSISFEVEQFRTRVSFSVPMFLLFVALCLSTGALLAWAYTYRLAGMNPFGNLFGG